MGECDFVAYHCKTNICSERFIFTDKNYCFDCSLYLVVSTHVVSVLLLIYSLSIHTSLLLSVINDGDDL